MDQHREDLTTPLLITQPNHTSSTTNNARDDTNDQNSTSLYDKNQYTHIRTSRTTPDTTTHESSLSLDQSQKLIKSSSTLSTTSDHDNNNIDHEQKHTNTLCWQICLLWIPLSLSLFGAITIYITYLTLPQQLALRMACEDMGLPFDCNDDQAIQSISSLSLLTQLLPGILALITLPIFSTYAHKLGRRKVMASALIGPVISAFGWYLLHNSKSLFNIIPFLRDKDPSVWIHQHWKLIITIFTTIGSIFGNLPILNYAVYSTLSDISALHPHRRALLFVSMELILMVLSVLGLQACAFMLKTWSDQVTTSVTFFASLGVSIVAIILYPETITPEVREQPIDKSTLTIFGPLKMIFGQCFTSVREFLDNDIVMMVDYLHLQQKLGTVVITDNDDQIDYDELGHHDDGGPTSYDNDDQSGINIVLNQSTKAHNSTDIDNIHRDIIINNCNIESVQQKIINDTNCKSEDKTNPVFELEKPLLTIPYLPQYIPHRNIIMLFLFVLTCSVIIDNATTIAVYYYLKSKWDISPQTYSNVFTYSTFIGAVISLSLFPLLQAICKTTFHEIILSFFLYIIQSIFFFIQSITLNYTFYVIAAIGATVVTSLPASIIRTLILNQVSIQKQPYMLTVLSLVQAIATLVGGVIVNALWIQLTEWNNDGNYNYHNTGRIFNHYNLSNIFFSFTTTTTTINNNISNTFNLSNNIQSDNDDAPLYIIWIVLGVFAVIAGILPLIFKQDSSKDINMRNDIVKWYTKLTTDTDTMVNNNNNNDNNNNTHDNNNDFINTDIVGHIGQTSIPTIHLYNPDNSIGSQFNDGNDNFHRKYHHNNDNNTGSNDEIIHYQDLTTTDKQLRINQ